MRSKTKAISKNQKQVESVKKEAPHSPKSLLSIKHDEASNRPGLINSVALRESAAQPQNVERVEKYRNVLENIHDGYFEVDLAGNFTFFNDSVCRVLGYTRQELMGMNYRHYTDEETAKEVFVAYNKVYNTGESAKGYNWPSVRKDGARRYIETSVSLKRDLSGKSVGFTGIVNDITDRKRIEEALLRETNFSRAALDSLTVSFFMFDAHGKMIRWNKQLTTVSGYSDEEIVKMKPSDFIAEKDWGNLQRTMKNGFKTGHASYELNIVCKDGAVKPHLFTGNLVFFEGKPYAVGMGIDITERKLMEDKLHHEEQRFHALIEHSSDIIVLMDREGVITYVNPAVERVLGFKAEERIGAKGFERIHPDDLKLLKDYFNILTTDKNAPVIQNVMRLRHKDGSWRTLEAVGSNLVNNNVIEAIIVNYRDITERKKVEEKLQAEERRFRILAEQSSDIILLMNNEGTILYENPAVEKILGREREERIGKNVFENIHRDDLNLVTNGFNALIGDKNAPPQKLEIRIRHREGSWRTFEVVASNLTQENVVEMIIVNLRDITERKQVEDELRKSEQKYLELSIIDDLTQLYNSRYFYAQLEKEMERSNRYKQPLTLLLLDLDRFKVFNDTYGHVEGDHVLARLGLVIKRCLRETDSAYRYGGEEFTVILPMTTSEEGIVTAKRIQTELSKESFSQTLDQKIYITVSIGLSQYKFKEEMKPFVHRVDRLMYQAKKNGRDMICSES